MVFQKTTFTPPHAQPGTPPKQALSAFRADDSERIWTGECGATIVIDGILTENHMLSFKKTLTRRDVEAVRAYLVSVANDSRNTPQPAAPAAGIAPQQPNMRLQR
nr:H576 [uncultured bacterium]